VTRAIRKHLKDFLAIIVLIVVSAAVAVVILSHQRLTLPGWVPFIGKSFFTLKAEFSTAQAVTPGQGQTVDIAGVAIGQISTVNLVDGRAVVTMKVKKKYASLIHPDATALLRPKTGLKDMIVELEPGTRGRPVASGFTIPVSATAPDVNLDELLASLDADSRDYLQLLVNGAGTALAGNGGKELAAAFKRFDPTTRDLRKINGLLSKRSENVRSVVHNFSSLSQAIAGKDKQLATLVDASNTAFGALADQDANLRRTLQLLPGALSDTNKALSSTTQFANQLGPTLQALRPGARALGPALKATQPFLRKTTPVIAKQLRPFTKDALPTITALRPAANDLASATPNLTTTGKVVNVLLNELAYNPPGNGVGQEGYLFWLAWANHDANAVFSTQDAMGSVRRGLLVLSCSSVLQLNAIGKVNPTLGTLVKLLNLPICPSQAGAGSQGSNP
jgi:phospholipid/cholesterol/gamma-HCH transport system substrate-binding protein